MMSFFGGRGAHALPGYLLRARGAAILWAGALTRKAPRGIEPWRFSRCVAWVVWHS